MIFENVGTEKLKTVIHFCVVRHSKTSHWQEKYTSLLPGISVFALIKFCCSNHILSYKTGQQENLATEDRKCIKCKLSDVRWNFIFFLNALCTMIIIQIFSLTNFFNHLHHIIFVHLFFNKERSYFNFVKICMESKNYFTPHTTATDHYTLWTVYFCQA